MNEKEDKSRFHQGEEKFGIRDNCAEGRKFAKKQHRKYIRRLIKGILRMGSNDEQG